MEELICMIIFWALAGVGVGFLSTHFRAMDYNIDIKKNPAFSKSLSRDAFEHYRLFSIITPFIALGVFLFLSTLKVPSLGLLFFLVFFPAGFFLTVEALHIIRAVKWYSRFSELRNAAYASATSNHDAQSKSVEPAPQLPSSSEVAPVSVSASKRMFCRKCGKQIPDDSEFCYKCGAPVIRASERTETSRKEPVNLEKEKLKPAVDNADKRVCPNCGKEIPSPMWRICPHCAEKLSQPDKPPETENEAQRRYNKALVAFGCSNDINTLREARDTFISLGDYLDSALKVQECMDKIYKIKNL